MGTFSLHAFQDALAPLFALDRRDIGSQPRLLGGARGVGVDLLLASHNADHVHAAAMQLAYVEDSTEFDAFSRQALIAFLSVILGGAELAARWLTNALEQLKEADVTASSTTHLGFVLTLRQQKPYQMFVVTAYDDDTAAEPRA